MTYLVVVVKVVKKTYFVVVVKVVKMTGLVVVVNLGEKDRFGGCGQCDESDGLCGCVQ